jgi:uncharacterized protein YciI
MFFIDLKYLASFEDVSVYMDVHLNHLQKYYDEKVFVVWGSKVPRTGGVILAFANSREQIEAIISEDPFYRHKLAEFTVTEFLTPVHHPDLLTLLSSGPE